MSANPVGEMRIDHVGMSVADLERSSRFYTEVLGFTTVEENFQLAWADIRGRILVNPAGARIELFERQGSKPGVTGHPTDSTLQQGLFQFALTVTDVTATFERTTAAGAKSVLTPRVAPDGKARIAFIGDPDGNLVELIQRG